MQTIEQQINHIASLNGPYGYTSGLDKITELALSEDGKYVAAGLQGLIDHTVNRRGALKVYALVEMEKIIDAQPRYAFTGLQALKDLIKIEERSISTSSVNSLIIRTAQTIAIAEDLTDGNTAVEAMQIIANTPCADQPEAFENIGIFHPQHLQTALANLVLLSQNTKGMGKVDTQKRQKSIATAVKNVATTQKGAYRQQALQTLREIATPQAAHVLYKLATEKKEGRRIVELENARPNALAAFQALHAIGPMAVTTIRDFKISAQTVGILADMNTPSATEAIGKIAIGDTAAQAKAGADIDLFDVSVDALQILGNDDAAKALSNVGQYDPSGDKAIGAFQAILDLYKNGLKDDGELREDAPFTKETVQRAAAQLTAAIIDPKNLADRLTDEKDLYGGKKAVKKFKQIIPIFEEAVKIGLIPGKGEQGTAVYFAMEHAKNAAISHARAQTALNLRIG